MASKGLTGQIWGYVKAEKKWWLLPVLVMLVLVGSLLVMAQGSALAPFIYSLF
jgi:hypothetical protein